MTELNIKNFISPDFYMNNEKYNILLQNFSGLFKIYVQKLDLNQFIEEINILNQNNKIQNYRVFIRKINVNKNNQIEFFIVYQGNNNIILKLEYNTNIIKNTNINSKLKNEIFLLSEEFIKNFFSNFLKNCTYLSNLNHENIHFSTKTFYFQELNISRKDLTFSIKKFIKYILTPFNDTIKKINIYDQRVVKNTNNINWVKTNNQLLNNILLNCLSDPNIIDKNKYKKILNDYKNILIELTYFKFKHQVLINIIENPHLQYEKDIYSSAEQRIQHYFTEYNCWKNMFKNNINNKPIIIN